MNVDRTVARTESIRNTGPGINPTQMCWACNLPKDRTGGAYMGRFRLFHCVTCKPIEEARVAAARAARKVAAEQVLAVGR